MEFGDLLQAQIAHDPYFQPARRPFGRATANTTKNMGAAAIMAKVGTEDFRRRAPKGYAKDPYYGKKYNGRGKSPRRTNKFTTRTVGPLAVDVKFQDLHVEKQVINNSSASWISTTIVPSPQDCLFAPTNGSQYDQRIGRRCSVKKIFIRGLIDYERHYQVGNWQSSPNTVRILLVQDMQTNGVQMDGSMVLETPENPASTLPGLVHCAPQNLANLGRFRILKDKTFVLQNPNMNGNASLNGIEANFLQKPFKFTYKPLHPIEVNFNQTSGGDIADIVDNSFHIIAHSTRAPTGLSEVAYLTYYSRVTFTG